MRPLHTSLFASIQSPPSTQFRSIFRGSLQHCSRSAGNGSGGFRKRSRTDLHDLGLIPSWSADSKGFINARSETLEDKPSFSESFQRRRCLIPSDGFFEWRRAGRAKQPFYFQLQGDEEFAFAGIWDRWGKGNSAITTCAIITTKANAAVAELHDRMPVILTPESYGDWLDPRASHSALKQLLVPFPASRMSWHPVSSAVNRTENDNPDLVTRVDTEIGTTPSLF